MDGLLDRGDDYPTDGEIPMDCLSANAGEGGVIAPAFTENEWFSIFLDPKLLKRLWCLAYIYFPGHNRHHKRIDMVDASIDRLLDLAMKKKAKSPAATFVPINHARHAFHRVMRSLSAKKRNGFLRIRTLSELVNSGMSDFQARPSNLEHQARLAFEIALARLAPAHKEIALAWHQPGAKRTYQIIADQCKCTKGTVFNVVKRVEGHVLEIMEDLHLC
jgi:hypothetical protein